MERAAYLGLLVFDWGEDVQRAAALIFATSSHSFSWCQKHCESVSHSYAATDGPIPLLQLSRRRDSWGPVSWFRASFIFLLANDTEALLEKKRPRGGDPRRARTLPGTKKMSLPGQKLDVHWNWRCMYPAYTHMQICSHITGPTQGLIVCLLFSLRQPYVAASWSKSPGLIKTECKTVEKEPLVPLYK